MGVDLNKLNKSSELATFLPVKPGPSEWCVSVIRGKGETYFVRDEIRMLDNFVGN